MSWTIEAEKALLDNYTQHGSNVEEWQGVLLGTMTELQKKTSSAIRNKARRLGLKFEGDEDEVSAFTSTTQEPRMKMEIKSAGYEVTDYALKRALEIFEAKSIVNQMEWIHNLLAKGKRIDLTPLQQKQLHQKYGDNGKDWVFIDVSNEDHEAFALIRGRWVITVMDGTTFNTELKGMSLSRQPDGLNRSRLDLDNKPASAPSPARPEPDQIVLETHDDHYTTKLTVMIGKQKIVFLDPTSFEVETHQK